MKYFSWKRTAALHCILLKRIEKIFVKFSIPAKARPHSVPREVLEVDLSWRDRWSLMLIITKNYSKNLDFHTQENFIEILPFPTNISEDCHVLRRSWHDQAAVGRFMIIQAPWAAKLQSLLTSKDLDIKHLVERIWFNFKTIFQFLYWHNSPHLQLDWVSQFLFFAFFVWNLLSITHHVIGCLTIKINKNPGRSDKYLIVWSEQLGSHRHRLDLTPEVNTTITSPSPHCQDENIWHGERGGGGGCWDISADITDTEQELRRANNGLLVISDVTLIGSLASWVSLLSGYSTVNLPGGLQLHTSGRSQTVRLTGHYTGGRRHWPGECYGCLRKFKQD